MTLKEHLRQNIVLALPVVIGQLGHIMVGVADSVMVGRLGVIPLAAATFAGTIYHILMLFGIGVSYAITPRVALDLGVNYIFASGDTFWTDSTGHSWSNTPDCLEGSAGLTYYFD